MPRRRRIVAFVASEGGYVQPVRIHAMSRLAPIRVLARGAVEDVISMACLERNGSTPELLRGRCRWVTRLQEQRSLRTVLSRTRAPQTARERARIFHPTGRVLPGAIAARHRSRNAPQTLATTRTRNVHHAS